MSQKRIFSVTYNISLVLRNLFFNDERSTERDGSGIKTSGWIGSLMCHASHLEATIDLLLQPGLDSSSLERYKC